MGRIDSFHIKSRVGLCITTLLSLHQHIVKGAALVPHLCQYKVAGAIDYPRQPLNAVGRKSFPDRLDNRNTACDGGFECNGDTFNPRGIKNFITMLGDQRLIRRDHMLALLNGIENQLACDRGATNQLYQNIDIGIAGNRKYIFGNRGIAKLAGGIWAPACHLHYLNAAPRSGIDYVTIAL